MVKTHMRAAQAKMLMQQTMLFEDVCANLQACDFVDNLLTRRGCLCTIAFEDFNASEKGKSCRPTQADGQGQRFICWNNVLLLA